MLSESDSESDGDESEDNVILLPNYQRCIAHTLNLIGSNSPKAAAQTNAKYRLLMHSTNGKFFARLTVQSLMKILKLSLAVKL